MSESKNPDNESLKALKRSEERYQTLYQKTPAMLHSINREGELVDVSDRWLKVLGYTRPEVIGRKVSDFLTEESRKHAETVAIPEFIRKGSAESIEYQFVKENGQVVDILLSAIAEYDDNDNFERSLSVLTDVTDKRQVEEELRFRNALLSTQQDASIDGLLVVDQDRNWVDYNHRFIDMWEIPLDVGGVGRASLRLKQSVTNWSIRMLSYRESSTCTSIPSRNRLMRSSWSTAECSSATLRR